MNTYAVCFNGVFVFHLDAIGQWHAVIKATETPEYRAAVKRLKPKELLWVTAFPISKMVH